MASTITCCSLSTCVQLLCFLLLLLHLMAGIVPLATGHIHQVSIFFQAALCPNTSDNATISSCSAMEQSLVEMVVPSMQVTNIILAISNGVLLCHGLSRAWLNILYLATQAAAAMLALGLAALLIFCHHLQGIQVR